MPEARAEIVEIICSFNSGVTLTRSMKSFLSSIFSVISRSISDLGAAMFIWAAVVKTWQMSSLLGRLVTKSLVEPYGRDRSTGKKCLLSCRASHSSRASTIIYVLLRSLHNVTNNRLSSSQVGLLRWGSSSLYICSNSTGNFSGRPINCLARQAIRFEAVCIA